MAVNLKWRTLKNGSKSYYLDINYNGKRDYEFLKISINKSDPDRKEKTRVINAIRAQRELELTTGMYNHTPSHKKKINFLAYYQNYLDNYSKKDVRKVKYSFEKFKAFLNKGSIQIKEVTTEMCEGFLNYLKGPKSGLNGETPYDYWKRFKGVLNQAVKDGIITNNPAEHLIFRGHNQQTGQLRKEILTEAELQLIAKTDCNNAQVKRAFLFACFTGLGLAEIKKLTWSRISNGKIKLNREKNGAQIINDLPTVALQLLGERGNSNDLIFLLPSAVTVGKSLKRWIKTAGIEKNISFYCGRHTFAVQLLLNDVNLKTVADLMGHTSTKHTLKYLHYTDTLKGDAIKSLPQISINV